MRDARLFQLLFARRYHSSPAGLFLPDIKYQVSVFILPVLKIGVEIPEKI